MSISCFAHFRIHKYIIQFCIILLLNSLYCDILSSFFCSRSGMRRRSDASIRSHIGCDVADHAETLSRRRNRYVYETYLFETSLRRLIGTQKKPTNFRHHNDVPIDNLSETVQFNTSQRCHNWYLNETDVFETLQRRTSWYVKDSELPEIPKKRVAQYPKKSYPLQ